MSVASWRVVHAHPTMQTPASVSHKLGVRHELVINGFILPFCALCAEGVDRILPALPVACRIVCTWLWTGLDSPRPESFRKAYLRCIRPRRVVELICMCIGSRSRICATRVGGHDPLRNALLHPGLAVWKIVCCRSRRSCLLIHMGEALPNCAPRPSWPKRHEASGARPNCAAALATPRDTAGRFSLAPVRVGRTEIICPRSRVGNAQSRIGWFPRYSPPRSRSQW